MTTLIAFAALIAFGVTSSAVASSAVAAPPTSRPANPLPFRYVEGQTEPRAEVRDPCIVRDGDRYYLVFTMWPFRNREAAHLAEPNQGGSPGIALYSSSDLTDWRFENWLVKADELPDDCPYKNRFWAPELKKLNGKWYLAFTADNWLKPEHNPAGNWGTAGHAFVGVADAIKGPYRNITWVRDGPCDMSLFADADGTTWAVKPKMDVYVQRIDLTKIEEGKVTLTGPETRVVTADNADVDLPVNPDYLEGPWLERIGGKYHLFHAAIYRDERFPAQLGYRTNVAVADRVEGPYAKNPTAGVFFGGHVAIFDGPDARKWFSYRWEKTDEHRGLLCADPFDVDARGAVTATETPPR